MSKAKTASKVYTGPRCFDGEFTRAMPEDREHYTITLDEIKTFPKLKWEESKQQWEFQE